MVVNSNQEGRRRNVPHHFHFHPHLHLHLQVSSIKYTSTATWLRPNRLMVGKSLVQNNIELTLYDSVWLCNESVNELMTSLHIISHTLFTLYSKLQRASPEKSPMCPHFVDWFWSSYLLKPELLRAAPRSYQQDDQVHPCYKCSASHHPTSHYPTAQSWNWTAETPSSARSITIINLLIMIMIMGDWINQLINQSSIINQSIINQSILYHAYQPLHPKEAKP